MPELHRRRRRRHFRLSLCNEHQSFFIIHWFQASFMALLLQEAPRHPEFINFLCVVPGPVKVVFYIPRFMKTLNFSRIRRIHGNFVRPPSSRPRSTLVALYRISREHNHPRVQRRPPPPRRLKNRRFFSPPPCVLFSWSREWCH